MDTPEKKISASEQSVHLKPEAEPQIEKKEILSDEKMIEHELRREIELMQVNPDLEKQASEKANRIQFLAEDDKLQNLLRLAKEKGIVFAIKVAKSMNEPYLLDIFHDMLAKEGYYKNFKKE